MTYSNAKYACLLLFTFLLVICSSTRGITERYIKTKIEEHVISETKSSTIQLYYQTSITTDTDYLEVAGFMDDKQKKLIIAGDKIYKYRSSFKGDPGTLRGVTIINLKENECRLIVRNIKDMLDRIDSRKPKNSKEVIYEDLTVNEELFLSFSKSRLKGTEFSLWMKGEKFTVGGRKFYESVKDFIEM